MQNKTITQLAQGLRAKEFSSVELTQHFLNRIEKHADLNAYITVTAEQALQAAQLADARIASGNAELLTGIPMAHKDIFCTQDVKTTCGSKMLDNFIAPYNATVVEKLNAAATATATGQWRLKGPTRGVKLKADVVVHDLGRFSGQMGHPERVKGGSGTLQAQVDWVNEEQGCEE